MSCGEDNDQEGAGTSSLNSPEHGLKTSCVKGGTHPVFFLQPTHILFAGALATAPEVRDELRREVAGGPGPLAGREICRCRARQLIPADPGAPTGEAVPVAVRAEQNDLGEPEPRRGVEVPVVARKVVVPLRGPAPRLGVVVGHLV